MLAACAALSLFQNNIHSAPYSRQVEGEIFRKRTPLHALPRLSRLDRELRVLHTRTHIHTWLYLFVFRTRAQCTTHNTQHMVAEVAIMMNGSDKQQTNSDEGE